MKPFFTSKEYWHGFIWMAAFMFFCLVIVSL